MKKKRHITLGPEPSGPTCKSCRLAGLCAHGHRDPVGSGFAAAYGTMSNGVLLVTEALDSTEDVKKERALAGVGGFLLARTLHKAGMRLDEFRVVPALRCMPSQGLRGGKPYRLWPWAADALAHCASNLDREIAAVQPKVIVTLGEVATAAVLGEEYTMMAAHGYAFRDRRDRAWVIPTFDPSWCLRGNNVYAQVMLWDIQKALKIAQEGFSYETPLCLLDPIPRLWEDFVGGYEGIVAAQGEAPLAMDIETPYKQDVEDEDALAPTAGADPVLSDITYHIDRVSAAYTRADGTEISASVAKNPMYDGGIKRLLVAGLKRKERG